MALQGLVVSVLRDASLGDCTLKGVTSPAVNPRGQILLLGIPGGNYSEDDVPLHQAKGIPVMVVRKRVMGGEEYVDAVPYGEKRHTMAGGNFLYSHDSRFRSVCQYPISAHDRIEG